MKELFEINVTETNTITFCATAEFPVQIFFIDGNYGCSNIVILADVAAGACDEACCAPQTVGPGTYWLWVGTQGFSGVPCGSDYVMTIDGFTGGGTPAESSTWGSIKGMFK